MSRKENWKRIILMDGFFFFFNLDASDDQQFNWHEQVFSKRQEGSGPVMACAGFVWQGKTDIVLLNNHMNFKGYQNILNDHLLPLSEDI